MTAATATAGDGKFHFAIDRGGTFTDVYCKLPAGDETVGKLLSEDPSHYPDAPTEGIRRILERHDDDASRSYPRGVPVNTAAIGSIRMGTTVATNALLERAGAKTALVITAGFGDCLDIGNQSRPDIFDLSCRKPGQLYAAVAEISERLALKQYAPDDWCALYPERVGVTGESVLVLKEPDPAVIERQLRALADDHGVTSLAVCLMHSYVYAEHERIIGAVAAGMKCFDQISLSHAVMPMSKLVSRGQTCTAAAYLTPKITSYLEGFRAGFDAGLQTVPLQFMKSDGGLADANDFGGHQAILSGPAGGVVGYAKTTKITDNTNRERGNSDNNDNGKEQDSSSSSTTTPPVGGGGGFAPVIGFDMGGTSTDVSRYAGSFEHVFETVTAGITVQAPQLDVHTVAAGGGSRLFLRTGLFVVGPESAGAHPGPVCYRKRGGLLAVTDANAVLGRVVPKYFPAIFGDDEDQPLDRDGAVAAFTALAAAHADTEAAGRTVEELAFGFIQVANEAMCRPIRNLTQMKGYDITKHALACFGGAGPQHACAMAAALGIKTVYVHKHGGILSAYGLSMADAVREEQEPAAEVFKSSVSDSGTARLEALGVKAKAALVQQGYGEKTIVTERYLNMRYQGTDNAIMIRESSPGNLTDFQRSFEELYRREFGFLLQGRDVLVDDYRVRAIVPGPSPPGTTTGSGKEALEHKSPPEPLERNHRAYFNGRWMEVPVYDEKSLLPGHVVTGPAMIIQSISTVVIEPDCVAEVTSTGDLIIAIGVGKSSQEEDDKNKTDEETAVKAAAMTDTKKLFLSRPDPVQLSIFAHRFMGIAEQMGRVLQRTAISVNMKERLDFSCALFTSEGGLVANAPHIPVHLGAMERAVRYQVEYWSNHGGIREGDVLVSNHPQLAGGSHLPDITVITPVFHNGSIIFFTASRGHHADIGGIAPGSMPPHSSCLLDEGATIVAFKLVKAGVFQEEGISDILLAPGKLGGNNSGTRNLRDNLSDLRAQVAANQTGIRLLQELVQEYGLPTVDAYMHFIQKNAEHAVRQMLMEFATKKGTCTFRAVDYMDDGSPVQLTVTIDEQSGSAVFDFTGTGPQVLGNHNAPPAVTYSAVIYALRSLVAQDIPLNQGCLAPVKFVIPDGCLLCPSPDAGVVGGNVLTSQRIVDVVLKAFGAAAASQGCMNNLTFGDDDFGYYETIAGGAGAGPSWHGTSAIHTHCTNTRITDPEILERRYPVLLRQFAIRAGSGGSGLYRGGHGVIREIEPLRPLQVSILSERRVLRPYGLQGGTAGAAGRNLLIRRDGVTVNVGGRCTTAMQSGERLRIETPGGGGYGNNNENQDDHDDTGDPRAATVQD